jgi:hypothetical protein
MSGSFDDQCRWESIHRGMVVYEQAGSQFELMKKGNSELTVCYLLACLATSDAGLRSDTAISMSCLST